MSKTYAYPTDEDATDNDIHLGTEVFRVIAVRGDVLAKLVQDCVHQIVLADEIYRHIFVSIHLEACLKTLLKIKACREGKTVLLQNIRTLHNPVQTEGPDLLAIEHTDHVIEIAVPDKPVRGPAHNCLSNLPASKGF